VFAGAMDLGSGGMRSSSYPSEARPDGAALEAEDAVGEMADERHLHCSKFCLNVVIGDASYRNLDISKM
jgi:hypothetical protein